VIFMKFITVKHQNDPEFLLKSPPLYWYQSTSTVASYIHFLNDLIIQEYC
jgi:hypothetical protein